MFSDTYMHTQSMPMHIDDLFQNRNYDEVVPNNAKILGLEDSNPSPNRGSAIIDYGIISSDQVIKSRDSSYESYNDDKSKNNDISVTQFPKSTRNSMPNFSGNFLDHPEKSSMFSG